MSGAHEARQFLKQLERPAEIQAYRLLHDIVAPNTACEFGRCHAFSSVASVDDFRKAVPIRGYEAFRSDIERAAAGATNVLVAEPIRHFFLTSGSTAAPKYVPVTGSFVRDKSRAFGIYWNLLGERYPEAADGKIVTNFADSGSTYRTEGGIPCGSENAYWSHMTAATRRRDHFTVPGVLRAVRESDARYYVLARLLSVGDFTVMMSLNPSTILLLCRKLDEFADLFLADVASGGLTSAFAFDDDVRTYVRQRCPANRELSAHLGERRQARGHFALPDVWPSLKLLVSWRSRLVQPYIELLRPYAETLPHVEYPCMASEGLISIPSRGDLAGGAIAVGTHFYEFIPEELIDAEDPETLLAHQLEQGRRYSTVLTTTAGLYRYDLGDVVEVVGFHAETPVVEFLHRAGATSSLTGEKLTEAQVSAAACDASRDLGRDLEGFTMVPSVDGLPHYVFLAEFRESPEGVVARGFLAALERELGEQNTEYRSKRDSQRLGPPELWLVEAGAYQALRRRRAAAGSSDGQFKPTVLSRDPEYVQQFRILERVLDR